MIGHEELLGLVDLVAKLRAAHATDHEEGAPCSHPLSSPPITRPVPSWDQLPPFNRQRLLWLLSQLLERQLLTTPAGTETHDATGE